MKKILIIERSEEYIKKVKKEFPREIIFYTADKSYIALARICEAVPDVIILGTNIGDSDPLDLLRQLKHITPTSDVIVVDREYSTKKGKSFESEGATGYIRKSDNPGVLVEAVNEALNSKKVHCLPDRLKILNEIIGSTKSASMMKYHIHKYSQNNHPIILMGETGTGKDLAASCIHRLSNRFDHRYIHLNCGAIPQTLAESELFGVEDGAYTDARKKAGSIELASRGTLFLNEIGELPLLLQVKLLKVLESKFITRLGGQVERPIDIRIIAATNKNIRKEVKEKRFREDLYYRINTLVIEIPPLRKRKQDIQLLAKKFLEDGKNPRHLSINALEKLNEYDWPGNIRQLKNVLDRAKVNSISESIRTNDIMFI